MVVLIFKGKGNLMSCGAYRGVKLLEHAVKIVERVLEKRVRCLVNMNKMQFGFMPGRGAIDALLSLRRMQEEYQDKGKELYVCFVDLEKAIDRVPRKVMEWAMMKKKFLEVMVKVVMSLYNGTRTKVKVASGLSDEFSVHVGVHKGSVLSLLLFAIVVDAVTERVRDGSINKILCADDLVLVGQTMKDLRDKFWRWKKTFEGKGMRVNLNKTKMMVSGLEEKVTASKIDPCGVCKRRVKVNAVFCTNCARWLHGRCTSMKRVTSGLAKNFVYTSCTTSDEDGVEPIENLCDGVETVNEFCYVGDKLKTGGGCEAKVTARMRSGWNKFRECIELLLGKRFLLHRSKQEFFRVVSGLQCCMAVKRSA